LKMSMIEKIGTVEFTPFHVHGGGFA
jgi:hypothetical protein